LSDSAEFAGVRVFWGRTGIPVCLNPADRKRLQMIVDDRNRPQECVRRARIVLATAATKGEVRSKAGLTRRRSPSGELRD
jgi:hypothetical protein